MKMKILNPGPIVISKFYVEYGSERYTRVEYNNGDIDWTPISYEGEPPANLEDEYQKLINSK